MKSSTTYRKCRRHRAGTTTVEMALVAPFIFMLIFGSIEFSRMMMVRQSLTNAARDGSRKACLVTTQDSKSANTAVRAALRGVIPNAASSDDLRVTVTPSFQSSPASGTEITTTVEIDCSDVSWLPPFFTAGAKLRCTSTMTRE